MGDGSDVAIEDLLGRLRETDTMSAQRILELYRRLVRDGVTDHTTQLVREVIAAFLFLGSHGHLPSVTSKPHRRREANVLVAYSVRNQPRFEGLHSSGKPLDNNEVKGIMMEACRRVDAWHHVKETTLEVAPELWWTFVEVYHLLHCSRWSDE